jgi:hypothetical protein
VMRDVSCRLDDRAIARLRPQPGGPAKLPPHRPFHRIHYESTNTVNRAQRHGRPSLSSSSNRLSPAIRGHQHPSCNPSPSIESQSTYYHREFRVFPTHRELPPLCPPSPIFELAPPSSNCLIGEQLRSTLV